MKYRKFFIVMFILILFSSLSSLLAPFFIQVWQSNGTQLNLQKIALIVVLIIISKVLAILFIVIREKFAKDYNKDNFINYISNVFNMRYDAIIDKGAMNLLERGATAVNSIYTYMTTGYIQIYSSVIVAIACVVFIGNISVFLAFIMLLAIPINYFGYKLLNTKLKEKSEIMQRSTGEGFQELLSYLQEVDYLKQLPDRNVIYQKFGNATEKIYGSMASVNEYAQSMTAVLQGINELIKTLLMLLVVYDFVTENTSVFTVILVTLIFPLYFSNLSTITNVNIQKRDFDVALDFEKEIKAAKEENGKKKLDHIDEIDMDVNGIQIKDLKLPFTANGTFKKGDIIRINGTNGSGKSSFAKTLVKFRDVNGVKYNGVPIEDCKNEDVRSHIEYVVQNAPIINGTLRNNLVLTIPATDVELEQNPFIQTILTKKSLNDEILANGQNLSGGEKQKISFARSLLSHPDVLILDEICSNIDKESSEEIYKYLDESRNERITFIISHDDLPEGLANRQVNV